MTPRLIDRIVDSKGRVLREFPLKPEKQLMSVGTANTVMAMLERVVQIGTGREAQVPGYRIAGKTGTAQRVREDGRGYSDDVIASFVGFFPVEDPRFVMLTLLDSPRKVHWASSNAAPLFGRIAADTLHHLSIHPTAPVQPRPVKKASPGA
jgi:stage V sporulation protein D (sporulation-specific penicillin-binding protein)